MHETQAHLHEVQADCDEARARLHESETKRKVAEADLASCRDEQMKERREHAEQKGELRITGVAVWCNAHSHTDRHKHAHTCVCAPCPDVLESECRASERRARQTASELQEQLARLAAQSVSAADARAQQHMLEKQHAKAIRDATQRRDELRDELQAEAERHRVALGTLQRDMQRDLDGARAATLAESDRRSREAEHYERELRHRDAQLESLRSQLGVAHASAAAHRAPRAGSFARVDRVSPTIDRVSPTKVRANASIPGDAYLNQQAKSSARTLAVLQESERWLARLDGKGRKDTLKELRDYTIDGAWKGNGAT